MGENRHRHRGIRFMPKLRGESRFHHSAQGDQPALKDRISHARPHEALVEWLKFLQVLKEESGRYEIFVTSLFPLNVRSKALQKSLPVLLKQVLLVPKM